MRLAPRDFWAMSLAEWRAMLTGFHNANGARAAPLARADLDRLMERYPDV